MASAFNNKYSTCNLSCKDLKLQKFDWIGPGWFFELPLRLSGFDRKRFGRRKFFDGTKFDARLDRRSNSAADVVGRQNDVPRLRRPTVGVG